MIGAEKIIEKIIKTESDQMALRKRNGYIGSVYGCLHDRCTSFVFGFLVMILFDSGMKMRLFGEKIEFDVHTGGAYGLHGYRFDRVESL